MSLQRAKEALRLAREEKAEAKQWLAYYKEKGMTDLEAQKAAASEMHKQKFVGKLKEGLHSMAGHVPSTSGGMMGSSLGGSNNMFGSEVLGGNPSPKKKKGDGGILGALGY